MVFLWPVMLIFLGLIPLIALAYIWMLKRRRRYPVKFSSLSLIRQAIPQTSFLRRHLPFVLFLAALASLLVALGRPGGVVTIPSGQATIILTIDVSGSMRSTDVAPSRLEAAQNAALAFVQRQNRNTQIGIVAFSTYAELIQPPTNDQEALQAAIGSLQTGRRTAIGSGILKAIDAIAEVDKNISPSVTDPNSPAEPKPVAPGVYAPDVIVLLTDGVSNTGPEPLDATKQAVDRGIRVYTIGFGSDYGFIPYTGGFGGTGNTNPPAQSIYRTGLDETVLKKAADMTGGSYYTATTAEQLQKVFNNLPTSMIVKHQVMEVSVFFVALGGLFLTIAIALSVVWHPMQ